MGGFDSGLTPCNNRRPRTDGAVWLKMEKPHILPGETSRGFTQHGTLTETIGSMLDNRVLGLKRKRIPSSQTQSANFAPMLSLSSDTSKLQYRQMNALKDASVSDPTPTLASIPSGFIRPVTTCQRQQGEQVYSLSSTCFLWKRRFAQHNGPRDNLPPRNITRSDSAAGKEAARARDVVANQSEDKKKNNRNGSWPRDAGRQQSWFIYI